MNLRLVASFVFIVVLLAACDQITSPNISQFIVKRDTVAVVLAETSYVQISSPWIGFNHPQAIIIGREPLVYVADTDNDRVVMLDLSGVVIGYSQKIKHPVALAEDYRLNLLVCAEFDTLLAGHPAPTTFGAVYRLDLVSQMHMIASVVPKRVIWDPSDSTRRYTGVATLYDNTYYLARTGPKNASTNLDRDDAVLLFSKTDSILDRVTNGFSADGTGLFTVHYLTALATMPTGKSTEFLYAQMPSNAGINPTWKVQWYRKVTAGQTTNWESRYRTGVGIDVMSDNRFTNPRGLAVDPSGNLFVADAGADSVFRFTSQGMSVFSIGKSKDGRNYFVEPYGVAFADKTVYVVDRGSSGIFRFKLSIDL